MLRGRGLRLEGRGVAAVIRIELGRRGDDDNGRREAVVRVKGAVSGAVSALRRGYVVHDGSKLRVSAAVAVVLLLLRAALRVRPCLDNHLLHLLRSVVVAEPVVPVGELHMHRRSLSARLHLPVHWRVWGLPSCPPASLQPQYTCTGCNVIMWREAGKKGGIYIVYSMPALL